jgi:isoleucyl-tRNA synthetase
MYCDARDSIRRRSTQTVMQTVFSALCRLLAPILVYTTDEAWEHAGFSDSVHEQKFPEIDPAFADKSASAVIARLQEIRATIQVAIEECIKAKEFTKNNEAVVTLTVPQDEKDEVVNLLNDRDFSTEFFILADLKVSKGDQLKAKAEKTTYAMCPRCRRYEPIVEGNDVCERCAAVTK